MDTIDLACFSWSGTGRALYAASTTLRQMEVFDRTEGSAARKPAHDDLATQLSKARRFAVERAIRHGKPPIDSAHLSPSKASSTHNMEGVLIVSPSKIPAINLPALVIWNSFGTARSLV